MGEEEWLEKRMDDYKWGYNHDYLPKVKPYILKGCFDGCFIEDGEYELRDMWSWGYMYRDLDDLGYF